MTQMLQNGMLWPRWVPYLRLGYGYPIFNFYSPGTAYVGGILGLAGISAPSAYNLINAGAWVIGSIGTYLLGRQFLPGKVAILASIIWAYAPSRFFEFWWRGSLAQSVGSAFIPWIFWALILVVRRPTYRHSLVLAFLFAGLVLSHQPTTFITGFFLAPAAILVPWVVGHKSPGTFRKRFAFVMGSLLLGLGLSAIFWLPALTELHLVKASQTAPDNTAFLLDNFLRPAEWFQFPRALDTIDLRLEMPRTLGLFTGILGIIGILGLLRVRRFGLVVGLVLSVSLILFMTQETALDAWLTIPFFSQIRFPERLLRLGTVFIALLGASSLLLLPDRHRWQNIGLIAVSFAIIFQALPLIRPNQIIRNWPDMSAVDEIESELTYGTWGTMGFDEFAPVWGENTPYDRPANLENYRTNPFRIAFNSYDLERWSEVEITEVEGNTFRISTPTARSIRFRQYYFPGWSASLDSEVVDVYAEPEYGLLTVDLPPGEHTIQIDYTGTIIQHVAALISVISGGMAAGLYFRERNSQPTKTPAKGTPLSRKVALFIAGGSIILAVANGLMLANNPLWFRHQSSPDNPAYMQTPVRQSFGDTITLLGFTLEQDRVMPGRVFNLTLFWQAEDRLDREYRPVVQLVDLNISEAWAVSAPFFPGGGKTTTYTPQRFASDPHRLRIFEDVPPYVGHITVQMFDVETGEPLSLPDGSDRLLLEPLIRLQGNNLSVAHALDYQLGGSVELWCASVAGVEEHLQIDLFWHVTSTPDRDMTVLVHGLDSSGEIVVQNDGLPFDGRYPPSFWQPGQTLLDRHVLTDNPAIESIAVGLYTPDDLQRITVLQAGQPVPDNRILLPLADTSCLN